MAQNAFWGLEYLFVTFDPYIPSKCQLLGQSRQFQTEIVKYESPSISESTKPID